MTISYRTDRYRRNIPFRYLNRYRNKAELYRPKYRGVLARFGCSGGFRSFSAVFAFPAGTNLNGFFYKKTLYLQQLVAIIEASACQIINKIIFFFILAT